MQVFARLTGFLKGLGVTQVFDTNAGREVSLLETAAEFVHRYRMSDKGATQLASLGPQGETLRPPPSFPQPPKIGLQQNSSRSPLPLIVQQHSRRRTPPLSS